MESHRRESEGEMLEWAVLLENFMRILGLTTQGENHGFVTECFSLTSHPFTY